MSDQGIAVIGAIFSILIIGFAIGIFRDLKSRRDILSEEEIQRQHYQDVVKFVESKTYDQLLDISNKTKDNPSFSVLNGVIEQVFEERIEYLVTELRKYTDKELYEVVIGSGYSQFTRKVAESVWEHRNKKQREHVKSQDHHSELKQVLGLHSGADASEIKYAYKVWMSKNHPDKTTNAAEKARRTAMCKQINELYNKL